MNVSDQQTDEQKAAIKKVMDLYKMDRALIVGINDNSGFKIVSAGVAMLEAIGLAQAAYRWATCELVNVFRQDRLGPTEIILPVPPEFNLKAKAKIQERQEEVSRTIWKYELPQRPCEFKLMVPPNYRPVHFEKQGGLPHMWAEVDPRMGSEERTFYCYGTGHPIGDEMVYLGTVQCGGFVWHYYR